MQVCCLSGCVPHLDHAVSCRNIVPFNSYAMSTGKHAERLHIFS